MTPLFQGIKEASLSSTRGILFFFLDKIDFPSVCCAGKFLRKASVLLPVNASCGDLDKTASVGLPVSASPILS